MYNTKLPYPMCTAQKYADRANYAPSTEPTAQQAAPFQQWQTQFLLELSSNKLLHEHAFALFEDARWLHEHTDPTEGICLLLADFLTQHRGELGRHKYELAAVVWLIGHINRMKASFYCFNNETDYIDQYETALDQQKGGQKLG